MVGDSDGNLFLVYASGGRLNIAKGTPNTAGTAWTWEVIYTRTDATEMGEGIIDRGRWEDYRILSFFGQERPAQQLDYGSGTMIDGMPAPVHVIDFNVFSSDLEGSWAGYSYYDEFLNVNTGSFLGWINVSAGDFVWLYEVGQWLYLPEERVTDNGAWMFLYQ